MSKQTKPKKKPLAERMGSRVALPICSGCEVKKRMEVKEWWCPECRTDVPCGLLRQHDLVCGPAVERLEIEQALSRSLKPRKPKVTR